MTSTKILVRLRDVLGWGNSFTHQAGRHNEGRGSDASGDGLRSAVWRVVLEEDQFKRIRDVKSKKI